MDAGKSEPSFGEMNLGLKITSHIYDHPLICWLLSNGSSPLQIFRNSISRPSLALDYLFVPKFTGFRCESTLIPNFDLSSD